MRILARRSPARRAAARWLGKGPSSTCRALRLRAPALLLPGGAAVPPTPLLAGEQRWGRKRRLPRRLRRPPTLGFVRAAAYRTRPWATRAPPRRAKLLDPQLGPWLGPNPKDSGATTVDPRTSRVRSMQISEYTSRPTRPTRPTYPTYVRASQGTWRAAETQLRRAKARARTTGPTNNIEEDEDQDFEEEVLDIIDECVGRGGKKA